MTRIRRALLPALLAAAALACAIAVERSLACPIYMPPQPLRTLYKVSERVVVARVGAKEVLSAQDNLASVRTALHVTENVKGAPAEVLRIYHTEFVMNEAEEKAAQEEEEKEKGALSSGRRITRLRRGEHYLFFLDPREQGDGYEVNDEGYAIKRLSDEDLKVYLERLKELAEITRREPEDKLAVVEWLVRCAEQPATRWEGAYELLLSADAGAGGDAEAEAPTAEEQTAEESAAAEVKEPAVEVEPAPPAEAETQAAPEQQAQADPAEEAQAQSRPSADDPRDIRPDPELAPLLDAVQKRRLADALFATPDPLGGDEELMQLVKEFGDPRLPGFILARLRRFEDDAPLEAELWLRTLAASLKNERLVELVENYTQEAPYYEEEEQPEAEPPPAASGEASDATGREENSTEEVEETPVDPEVEEARLATATERATRKRSAMLKSLLSRIDLFVSTGQLAAN